MKKALFLMLASVFVVASLSLTACGDDDDDAVDNVSACESLLETLGELECTTDDFDWSTWIDCEAYADYACDLVDYWQCLEDGATCTDTDPSTLDLSAWADCANLASCE